MKSRHLQDDPEHLGRLLLLHHLKHATRSLLEKVIQKRIQIGLFRTSFSVVGVEIMVELVLFLVGAVSE